MGLLRARTGVASFPWAVTGALGQQETDVAVGGRGAPLPMVDVAGELDERDRLPTPAVLEPWEGDLRAAAHLEVGGGSNTASTARAS